MGMKADILALQKQIKPKTSVRFVYSMSEVKPIEGAIYIVYKQQNKPQK